MHPEYQANQQFLLLLLCLACSVLIMLCARENGKAGNRKTHPQAGENLSQGGHEGRALELLA